jgi:hypothetical protein
VHALKRSRDEEAAGILRIREDVGACQAASVVRRAHGMALHPMAAAPRTERRLAARYEDELSLLVVVKLGQCECVAPLHHGKRTV